MRAVTCVTEIRVPGSLSSFMKIYGYKKDDIPRIWLKAFIWDFGRSAFVRGTGFSTDN